MCTVTLIPQGNTDFVLTSNRDEAPNRQTLPPNFYTINDTNMLFPKDQLAGGTWIGVSETKRLLCLLNGGFTMHERLAEYRMSRGVVVKDLLSTDTLIASIDAYNLENIEPFTIVIVDWKAKLQFYELVWDGVHKHFRELPVEPHIWSSSSLYNDAMKTERQHWFETFMQIHKLTAETLLEFHRTTEKDNHDYGIVMDRGFVKTTSITQVVKEAHQVQMTFDNLQDQSSISKTFLFSEKVNG